ncbi:MAG: ABC transporter substrate-binding protein, partial [Chloroflexota bacterium]
MRFAVRSLGARALLVAAFAVVAAACGGSTAASQPASAGKAASASQAASAGGASVPAAGQPANSHATLVVDMPNAPATLDPGLQYDTDSYSVYRNIFDTLLHRDPSTLKVVPWVADSWKQVNPTTWTFAIHPNIKFQDGSPLTAQDVAFSLDRILDPSFHSPQFANFSVVKSASASGSTVTITTKDPSATLLSYLTTLSIVPEKIVKAKGPRAFNLNPIGSGPYKLKSWTQGSGAVLTANPNYWKGKPPFATVSFRAVPNDASRVADLQSGKADVATTLTPDDAANLKSSGSLQVLSTPTERVSYLAFNVTGPAPTKSLALREGLAYGIDYGSIVKNLLHGYGHPVKEVLTPLSFGYDKNIAGFTYDPAKAKQLIAQSGQRGATLEFATSPAYNQTLIQAMQGDLTKLGLTVKIVSTDQATYLKKVQSPGRNWGSIRFGRWSCSCLDADGTIYPLFHSGSVWSSYTNPQLDKLLNGARTTTDSAQRIKDYGQAFQILQRDVPGVGLFQEDAIYGAS